MLLSNMSKVDDVSIKLLSLKIPFSTAKEEGAEAGAAEETQDVEALDMLLEVFLKGEGKKYNPNANYDFLASVFANISTVSHCFKKKSPDHLLTYVCSIDSSRSGLSSVNPLTTNGTTTCEAYFFH